MGRRKIEIKAIKDDRNRSVTFLKRKGGLFKKAHELSVLCSVDVAVIIFGSNKKLYQYSSCDMNNLISRYTYHGMPNEHKGPADFNGGDDDDDDDENGSPPQSEGLDAHMLPPHFTTQPPFPQIRHHTPSASPPVQNGLFAPHPGHQAARSHTPQPQIGSRPSSRNDMRRMGPNMGPQPVGPPGPSQPSVNGYAFMPQPAIYNPQTAPTMTPSMPSSMPPVHSSYPYAPPQAHSQLQYMDSQRRASVPPNFPPGPSGPAAPRQSVSPPQPQPHQLPPQPGSHMSPPPPQIHHPIQSPPQPQHPSPPRAQEPPRPQEFQLPEPVEPKTTLLVKPEPPAERPRQALLLDTGVKKQKASIFTPVDEGRSILSQHLAAFHPEVKSEPGASRPRPIEVSSVVKTVATTTSPPPPQRPAVQAPPKRNDSVSSSVADTAFTPLSHSSSLQTPGGTATARPRLKVQIPDEPSDGGSATAESSSPRGASTDVTSQHSSRRPTDSHSSGVVLPPPSPSATALLSAGAIGPPNPFARPPPAHQNSNTNMNTDTPVSALPSRFLNSEFLPSPSSFYPEWNFRGSDSNVLQSPVNYSTPLTGNGPSFLRDDVTPHKRKSPEISGNGSATEAGEHGNASEPKRLKVETQS